jgi:hypothetical protein
MRRRFGSFGSRFSATPAAVIADTEVELDLVEETDMDDIPLDELREFLSADLFEVPADPIFKEGLREKLWEAIRSGSFGYGKSDDR